MSRTLLSLVALAAFLASQAHAQTTRTKAVDQAAAKPAAQVNLNTATVADLQDLPGVGAKVAARIVEYPTETRAVQEDRGADERPGNRREELPQAPVAAHGRRQDRNTAIVAEIEQQVRTGPVASRARACAGRPVDMWMRRAAGYSLIELLFALGLMVTLAGIAVPQILAALDDYRAYGAARYVSGRLHETRVMAVTRTVNTALRFSISGGSYT